MMTATAAGLTPESLTAITARVRPFTMAPDLAVHFTAMESVRLIAAGIPGVLVECGAWRGGCSMAMLLAQQAVFGQVVRPVHLLDSFAGLPPAADRDGPLARQWQSETDSPGYHDNCTVSEEQLLTDITSLGFSEGEYFVHPGWFADTLPPSGPNLARRPSPSCASTATGTTQRSSACITLNPLSLSRVRCSLTITTRGMGARGRSMTISPGEITPTVSSRWRDFAGHTSPNVPPATRLRSCSPIFRAEKKCRIVHNHPGVTGA